MSLRFRPTVEMLDRRDVPTVTLVNDVSYPLTGPVGSATVTVSVTTEGDGYYHWNYSLHNDSFVYGQDGYWGIGVFRVPIKDTFVTGMGSSIASNTSTANGFASWAFGTEVNPGLKPTQEAEFWFTTPEVPIGAADVEGWEPGYAVGVAGEALAPKAKTSITLDFATIKTGVAYTLTIVIKDESGQQMAMVEKDVTANMTAKQIRDSVAESLSAANINFETTSTGDTVLKIGQQNGKSAQSFDIMAIDPNNNHVTGPKLTKRQGIPTVTINGETVTPSN